MCLQDQKMAAMGKFNNRTDTPGAAVQQLPNLSQALWFGVYDSTGVPVQVFASKDVTGASALPRSSTMVSGNGTSGYYERDVCGSMFLGPLFYQGAAATTYFVTWLDMDLTTYGVVQSPFSEG